MPLCFELNSFPRFLYSSEKIANAADQLPQFREECTDRRDSICAGCTSYHYYHYLAESKKSAEQGNYPICVAWAVSARVYGIAQSVLLLGEGALFSVASLTLSCCFLFGGTAEYLVSSAQYCCNKASAANTLQRSNRYYHTAYLLQCLGVKTLFAKTAFAACGFLELCTAEYCIIPKISANRAVAHHLKEEANQIFSCINTSADIS